ncbi:MAG: putative Na+/H+ antiporter [Vicinamibacterales bacterium]
MLDAAQPVLRDAAHAPAALRHARAPVRQRVHRRRAHLAAPPVLMVSAPWDWNFERFGWKAALAILTSNTIYFLVFKTELRGLQTVAAVTTVDDGAEQPPVGLDHGRPRPSWRLSSWRPTTRSSTSARSCSSWVSRRRLARSSPLDLKPPLLVGFFLGSTSHTAGCRAGLDRAVTGSLTSLPLFWSTTLLTAFNDNAPESRSCPHGTRISARR